MWLIITIAIGIFVTIIPTQDLFALEMNVKGNTLFLSGQVVAGDQYDCLLNFIYLRNNKK